MDPLERNLRVAKFSVHVAVSLIVLLFAMVMLAGDFLGSEYRPIWSAFIGAVIGVWIKKPNLTPNHEGGGDDLPPVVPPVEPPD